MSKLRSQNVPVKGKSSSPFKTRQDRANDHEEKRLAVLKAAAELFVTAGFHSTKLSDVADRLNITKPAIYYYFESKDEILLECTRMALDASERHFAALDEKLSARERLQQFMVWYAESMTTPFGKCLVRVAEQDVEEETQKHLIAAKRVIYRRLLQLVEAGQQDGSIETACDAKVATFTIAGALSWLSHWHRPSGKLSAHEAAESVTQLLLNGLLPDKG
jgi:AcrR family transcriptional regulator